MRSADGQHQLFQLCYINSIHQVSARGLFGEVAGAGGLFGDTFGEVQTKPLFGNAQQHSPETPLMIVPIPNPHAMGEADFTLFEVDRARSTGMMQPLLGPLRRTPSRPFLQKNLLEDTAGLIRTPLEGGGYQ